MEKSNEEILLALSRCLRTATVRYGGDFRHLLSHPILQLEFLPYINRIISPPLRPVILRFLLSVSYCVDMLPFQVNSQIIRPLEKALMCRLVDIMSSLELRFLRERAEDGQLSYRLDPYVFRYTVTPCTMLGILKKFLRPIDVFVTYDGKRASDIAISRYAVRHLVAAAVILSH